MRNVSVSVITSAYNEEKRIKDYLECLQRQTFKDFELIIVDDGSTDNTIDIIKNYDQKLNIKILKLSHVGVGKAKAIAFKEAKGDIVFIIDADMIFPEDAIFKILQYFSDPDVGGVGAIVRSYGETWVVRGYGIINTTIENIRRKKDGTVDWISRLFAVRKDVVERLGGLSTQECGEEDVEISWNLRKNGFKIILSDVASYHKEHDTLRKLLNAEYYGGRKDVSLFPRYKGMILDWRILSRFYPIFFVVLIFIDIRLSLLCFGLTFIVSQYFFANNIAPIINKIYAWVILTFMNFAWDLGVFSKMVDKLVGR